MDGLYFINYLTKLIMFCEILSLPGEGGREEKAIIALDSMFYIPGKLCNVELQYKAINISTFLVYYKDNFVLKY